MNMNVASPKGYAPRQDILMKANEIAKKTGARLNILDRPREATAGADILYTDVWISMGEEKEEETKLTAFQGYQINSELLEIAAEDAVVMHCLPAHRGLEITNDVIEGPQSIVWQQAENKMHGAAGILDYFLS
jgi:ornithine carbamoyltransferase